MVFDYRYPFHAVPDKSEKIRHGYDNGDFKWFADGLDRHGVLGRTNGRNLWLTGGFDFEIWQL